MSQPVYLIDVNCFKPTDDHRVSMEGTLSTWEKYRMFSPEDTKFHRRIGERSGLSPDMTFLPHAINPIHCVDNPITDLTTGMNECRMTVTGAVEGLLQKTGLGVKDVDIVITTCSIFCPTPSMASMVINHFKFKPEIQSYHLGGMGCSNGVVAVNMVRDLLQAHPNVNALFITTETTSPCYYRGKDRHRQVPNLLFRMGAAAILFSNNASWGSRIKYSLQHIERVHVGQSDEAFSAIHYGPDEEGINGIYLGKNIVTEASRALARAMWSIGPKVLNLREKVMFARGYCAKKLGLPGAADYTPSFSGSVDHFLIHAGGAAVLDGLGKALRLTEQDMEPSRMVLHDYGNVSSSTTWYTLSCIETVRGVSKGDSVLQIGVGSGIKAGVIVWKATRSINDVHKAWEHRVPEEKRQSHRQQGQAPFVDISVLRRTHLISRLQFMLLMAIFVAVLHLFFITAEKEL